jgi:hypothetical protein
VTTDRPLRLDDILRHELKALRYMLDNFHAGRLAPGDLPRRHEFAADQSRAIYDAIVRASDRSAAEQAIAQLELDDVDVDSFLALSGAHYHSYPALVRQRAAAREGAASAAIPSPLHLMLDRAGALIAFQESHASWLELPVFSSTERALQFMRASATEAAEIAEIDVNDPGAVRALVSSLKRRGIRHLLLDLDYRTGEYIEIDLEGEGFGRVRERRLEPRDERH